LRSTSLARVSAIAVVAMVAIVAIVSIATYLAFQQRPPVQTAVLTTTTPTTLVPTPVTTPVPTTPITTTPTPSTTPQRGIGLVVLTRHPTDIQLLARQKFLQSDLAKRYGIVNVRFLYIDAPAWIDTIKQYLEAGRSIDIAWGGGPTLFDTLLSANLLAP
jgi:hypothetical protein